MLSSYSLRPSVPTQSQNKEPYFPTLSRNKGYPVYHSTNTPTQSINKWLPVPTQKGRWRLGFANKSAAAVPFLATHRSHRLEHRSDQYCRSPHQTNTWFSLPVFLHPPTTPQCHAPCAAPSTTQPHLLCRRGGRGRVLQAGRLLQEWKHHGGHSIKPTVLLSTQSANISVVISAPGVHLSTQSTTSTS